MRIIEAVGRNYCVAEQARLEASQQSGKRGDARAAEAITLTLRYCLGTMVWGRGSVAHVTGWSIDMIRTI